MVALLVAPPGVHLPSLLKHASGRILTSIYLRRWMLVSAPVLDPADAQILQHSQYL